MINSISKHCTQLGGATLPWAVGNAEVDNNRRSQNIYEMNIGLTYFVCVEGVS